MSFEKELTQELDANVDDLVLQFGDICDQRIPLIKVIKVQYIIGICVSLCVCLLARLCVHDPCSACARARARVCVCVYRLDGCPQF